MVNYLEILGTILGLLYLWFEYRASIWLWLSSIIMPAVYIFVYGEAGLYADMGINVYYLVASLYGWIAWMRKDSRGEPLPVSFTPRRMWKSLGAAAAVSFAAIVLVLVNFTDSTVPCADSFTTALSIVGLYMLAKKWAEQWLVWIAVDAVSSALYIYKGLYPTAGLYAVYTVVAVAGYFKWRSMALISRESATEA